MKGQIPVTDIIKLESCEDQWRLLDNGIIKELKTSGLIELKDGRTVRIRFTIIKALSPENNYTECRGTVTGNLGTEINNGLSIAISFASTLNNQRSWVLVGIIDGEERKPILIIYYQLMSLSIYTQKLSQEEKVNFFPNVMLN